MDGYKRTFPTLAALTLLTWAMTAPAAETWRLDKDQGLKSVSQQDKYLQAVAEIKKLVDTGQKDAVRDAWNKLKQDYPEITGPDLDAFIKGEMLLTEGKLDKAGKAYDKFLTEFPESKLYDVALQRLAMIAEAFLAGQKRTVLGVFRLKGYAEGEKIMDKIGDRAGDAPIGLDSAITVAESLENRRKFDEAYDKWSEVSARQPAGKIGQDALLAMARCKHAAYKGPDYDVSNLISAQSYYENYHAKHPTDGTQQQIPKKLENIEQQQAHKQFAIGQYYQKAGNTQAATLYYQMVIENWPESIAAKMATKQMTAPENADNKNSKTKKYLRGMEKMLLGKDADGKQ